MNWISDSSRESNADLRTYGGAPNRKSNARSNSDTTTGRNHSTVRRRIRRADVTCNRNESEELVEACQ